MYTCEQGSVQTHPYDSRMPQGDLSASFSLAILSTLEIPDATALEL